MVNFKSRKDGVDTSVTLTEVFVNETSVDCVVAWSEAIPAVQKPALRLSVVERLVPEVWVEDPTDDWGNDA
jgi:hypothetical protein